MEKINWLYTIEQMWGHQSQSAPLKQLKQRDALILHESTSPNLDKQSTDHSQWPLIYYSESKKTLENNNQLRLGETDHKTIIKRPPVLGGMSLICRICWNKWSISKECVRAQKCAYILMHSCFVLMHFCMRFVLSLSLYTNSWMKEGRNEPTIILIFITF